MYQTSWEKRQIKQELLEDNLILNSKFKPNEKVLYKNRIFKLNTPSVRDNELVWLAETKQGWFWLKDKLIV